MCFCLLVCQNTRLRLYTGAGYFAVERTRRDGNTRCVADALELARAGKREEIKNIVILSKPDRCSYWFAAFAKGRQADIFGSTQWCKVSDLGLHGVTPSCFVSAIENYKDIEQLWQVGAKKCYTYSMAHKEPKQLFIDTQSGAWQALELVADKWALVVLSVLACGKQRHGQLQRAIKGISAKMLTQTLRRLERDGLVARKVYPVVPPKVEYALTPLGQTVIEPLDAMCHWANTHWHEVLVARSAHQNELDAREDAEEDEG